MHPLKELEDLEKMNQRAYDPDIKSPVFTDSKPGSHRNTHPKTSEQGKDPLQKSQVTSTPVTCPPQTSFPMSILCSRILPYTRYFFGEWQFPFLQPCCRHSLLHAPSVLPTHIDHIRHYPWPLPTNEQNTHSEKWGFFKHISSALAGGGNAEGRTRPEGQIRKPRNLRSVAEYQPFPPILHTYRVFSLSLILCFLSILQVFLSENAF